MDLSLSIMMTSSYKATQIQIGLDVLTHRDLHLVILLVWDQL